MLNSEVEFLPNKAELSRRAVSNEGMTRAELSVLLSYSNMSFDLELSTAKLDDHYFVKYLFNYFPEIMRDKFKEGIINHTLCVEIIRTIITNKLVNQLGGPLISSIKTETGFVMTILLAIPGLLLLLYLNNKYGFSNTPSTDKPSS